MRQAEGELDWSGLPAGLGQGLVARITVHLQQALVARELGADLLVPAPLGEDVDDRRRRRPAPRPVIDRMRP